MLQLNYHSYITVKSPIKKRRKEANLMDIANPILNLEKQRKERHKFCHIPRNMDIVDWTRSPLHKCLVDGNENYESPFVCLMENGHNTLIAQSP